MFRDGTADPYHLLDELGEDQFVAILERPEVVASPSLARAIATCWVDYRSRAPGGAELLMREVMKRFRRLAAFVAFESLEPAELFTVMVALWQERQQPIQVTILATVPAKGDDSSPAG